MSEQSPETIHLALAEELLRVKGTARIVTDTNGKPISLVGTHAEASEVNLSWPSSKRVVRQVAPNAAVDL